MNILMLNYEYPPLGGGAGIANKYLLEELAGYDDLSIDLVTSSIDKENVTAINDRVKIHFLDIGKKNKNIQYQSEIDLLRYGAKAGAFAKKLMKGKKYDLAHAFFTVPSGFIAMGLKLPYIISIRGSDVPFHNPRFRVLDKFIFQHLAKKIWDKAEFVAANSESLAASAKKVDPQTNFEIVFNGVNASLFHPPSDEMGKLKDGIRFLYIGRLSEVKGIRHLLEAFNILSKRHSDTVLELWIVGEGNLRAELENFTRFYKIDDKVKFLHKIPNEKLSEIYRQADVLVMPSLNEGMSMVMVEAMATGLGVVATDIPALSKFVEDGVNGYTVKPEDHLSLAAGMEKYVKVGRATAKSHGVISRRKALGYSWGEAAGKYYEFYQKVKNG